ncbi:MAG: hypothetical protein IJ833_07930 [Lachnospiraceae bacterium]|nr:hypothetical protein [Lachnospiraceae bacterium]
MTRREKVLLQVLAAIAIVGLSFLYLFMPSVRRRTELKISQEELQMQEAQVRSIVNLTGLEEALDKEKEQADKNYEYFYSKLNSYTVDGILNGLVTESGLEVQSMTISSYNPIEVDTLKRGVEAEEKEGTKNAGEEEEGAADENLEVEEIDLLLGCRVNLEVKGSYGEVLELADKLRKESTCIEVTSISITREQRDVASYEPVSASMTLLIYGINKTVEEDA